MFSLVKKKRYVLMGFGCIMFQLMSAHACLRIGHRGACGYEPENTLRSFRKALELHVDMIELDVYCCASGELVVIHDCTLNRTTNGTGFVESKALSELKQLNAGKGERIPTLQEVFDCIDRKALINIELKGQGTAAAVAQIIHFYVATRNWLYSDFLVSSFDHHMLIECKQHAPQVKIGALLCGIPVRLAAFAQDCGADMIGVSEDCITQSYVDDAHSRGLKVFVFTVNEPDAITAMKQLGVDGIFSDYPDRV